MTEHTTPATQHASDELAEVGETAPSGELPAPAPELFERAREAVAALCGQGRLANGQAGPGNTLNLYGPASGPRCSWSSPTLPCGTASRLRPSAQTSAAPPSCRLCNGQQCAKSPGLKSFSPRSVTSCSMAAF